MVQLLIESVQSGGVRGSEPRSTPTEPRHLLPQSGTDGQGATLSSYDQFVN